MAQVDGVAAWPSRSRRAGAWFLLIFVPLTLAVGSAAGGVPARASGSADLANGPSFDCSHPSKIEAAICADPALSADDRRLAALYAAAKPGALGTGSSQLKVQRRFLKDLQIVCVPGNWKSPDGPHSLRYCIALAYHYRLEELALADLFMIHDTALAELTRQDPKSALIDEAIYQYATITDPASRTRRVASIIAPVFDQIRVHPAQVFNGRRMAPYVDFRLEKIATATDAAASDEGFSAFLYTASNWYIDRQTHPGGLTIPCAALVRSPGLLGAFGERFAPGSDCDATLPPTPRLDALVDAAFKAQPPCGGTIVKDTGAEFAQLMLRVRLNLRDTRFGPQKSASPGAEMDKDQQKFRNSHAQAVHNAIDEMTNYYVANFRMQPTAARAQAKQVVDLAVSGPFNLCE